MKITQESDYALRIVQYLANQEESRVGASIIAKDQDVPLRFALKILRKLNAAGITKAYRGVSGGYALTKEPGDISYKEVIEAIEGDIYLNRCLANKTNCTRDAADKCSIHKKLLGIQKFLDEELGKARF
jgi:Rrf2 family protein